MYPLPPLVIVIIPTALLDIDAVAYAPLPPPPIKVTLGAIV